MPPRPRTDLNAVLANGPEGASSVGSSALSSKRSARATSEHSKVSTSRTNGKLAVLPGDDFKSAASASKCERDRVGFLERQDDNKGETSSSRKKPAPHPANFTRKASASSSSDPISSTSSAALRTTSKRVLPPLSEKRSSKGKGRMIDLSISDEEEGEDEDQAYADSIVAVGDGRRKTGKDWMLSSP